MIVAADDVLSFWLDEKTPADWYKADDALDAASRPFGSFANDLKHTVL